MRHCTIGLKCLANIIVNIICILYLIEIRIQLFSYNIIYYIYYTYTFNENVHERDFFLVLNFVNVVFPYYSLYNIHILY